MKERLISTLSKEDFIGFLSSATPEELNELIRTEGKPPKLIDPMYFYDLDPEVVGG